ncbi:hypothetical protein FH972_021436 [Carpinus fangiana]|uniref:Uncharacterized protein n=1 Tax=Carpinus fangiana TaxID=176857 RepID=A0A5N6KPB5_9ROSI|nr:hypothetical protein FH972_021436 [Carpinus fangiana]
MVCRRLGLVHEGATGLHLARVCQQPSTPVAPAGCLQSAILAMECGVIQRHSAGSWGSRHGRPMASTI